MEIIKDSMILGYVCGNSLDRCFMPSVFGFMNYDAQNRHSLLGLGFEAGPFVDDNRNTLVRRMLAAPAEWFLFLDTDTNIEPTAPYILLDTAKQQGVKIITGLQFSFVDDGRCQALWWDKIADNGEFSAIGEIKFGELYKLAACGMGCCLIHRDVFEAFLKVPEWARDSWTWFGRDECPKPDNHTTHFGEDMTFFKRAGALGFEVLGHAGVEARHAKRFELGFAEFEIFYKANYRGCRA